MQRVDPEAARRVVRAARRRPRPTSVRPAARRSRREIAIDDFAKVDLRIAKIVAAEQVEGIDQAAAADTGCRRGADAQRVLAASVGLQPEQLVGKLTVMVANLAPRKMKFGSQRRHGAGRQPCRREGQPRHLRARALAGRGAGHARALMPARSSVPSLVDSRQRPRTTTTGRATTARRAASKRSSKPARCSPSRTCRSRSPRPSGASSTRAGPTARRRTSGALPRASSAAPVGTAEDLEALRAMIVRFAEQSRGARAAPVPALPRPPAPRQRVVSADRRSRAAKRAGARTTRACTSTPSRPTRCAARGCCASSATSTRTASRASGASASRSRTIARRYLAGDPRGRCPARRWLLKALRRHQVGAAASTTTLMLQLHDRAKADLELPAHRPAGSASTSRPARPGSASATRCCTRRWRPAHDGADLQARRSHLARP